MILLVAIIVIGPAKIAEFGKSVGKVTRNIKQASGELSRNLNNELEEEQKSKTVNPPPVKKT